MAANVDVLSLTGEKIGRAHHFDITTFEGARRYKGTATAIGNSAVDFGGGNFLFYQCVTEDSPTNNGCAIIGGTGRYSGRADRQSRTSPIGSRQEEQNAHSP
jgi:hypothetical protein